MQGVVSRKEGYHEPLPNVLFEIQGPSTGKKIRRATTDEHGRFKIGHVPAGTYKFKATLNGFQSVMGTITISKKATTENESDLRCRRVSSLILVPDPDNWPAAPPCRELTALRVSILRSSIGKLLIL